MTDTDKPITPTLTWQGDDSIQVSLFANGLHYDGANCSTRVMGICALILCHDTILEQARELMGELNKYELPQIEKQDGKFVIVNADKLAKRETLSSLTNCFEGQYVPCTTQLMPHSMNFRISPTAG